MDRIEQLMKDAKPLVGEPGAAPASDSARSIVFSTDPNVVLLAGRTPARRNAVRAAAATVLAAAAVVGAVVVGGNLMPQPGPGPAQKGNPIPTVTASPSPDSPSPSTAAPSDSGAASPTQASTAAGALSTGGVACTMANVDQQRNDQERAIKAIPAAEQAYYTVLGCADGWLAYSTSDAGIRALKLDGGNAWYKIARLRNGRFLCDVRQEWSSVFNWEFQATNNQGLTPQQGMDKEFADKGIPVELRPQLVGDGPPAR
jgi:hypothetical protein